MGIASPDLLLPTIFNTLLLHYPQHTTYSHVGILK